MDAKLILSFLKELSNNNNKEWFDANRPTYEKAKKEMENFIGEVIGEISKFDPSLTGLEPKKAMFRIFRDVRFSKDKTPYKTSFGASLAPGGRKMTAAGYYVHIEPGNKSIIAGGMWGPEKEKLAAIRQEIDYNANAFKKILGKKSFRETFGGLWEEDKLKTAPKGYPKDHPEIDLLRNVHFVVSHKIADVKLKSNDLLKQVATVSKELKPLNDFLNVATEAVS